MIFAGVTGQRDSTIYRDLMRFKPEALSPNAWAVKAGVSRTVWNDMRRHGNPSRRTLEKLLAVAGSSIAEFEALRIGPGPGPAVSGLAVGHVGDRRPEWMHAPLPPLPLIRSSLGNAWGELGSKVEVTDIRRGEVLERLQRPKSLAGDAEAFALTIVGDSMWPRFRPGSRVAVSPRVPVALGDDVLVRLRPSGTGRDESERVLIMQLVKRTANGFQLRQFNPDLAILVDGGDVTDIMKIVGELI